MSKIFFVLLSVLFSMSICAEGINYELARVVKVKRIGQHLIRYVSTLDDTCMGHFQSLMSDYNNNWSIYKTVTLCEMDGESTATGFAYAGISEVEFNEDSIHMVISTIPLISGGEFLRNCTIKVNKGRFSSMSCDKPERVGD